MAASIIDFAFYRIFSDLVTRLGSIVLFIDTNPHCRRDSAVQAI